MESSPITNANGTTKFPAFIPDQFRRHSDDHYGRDEPSSPYDHSPARSAQGHDGQWQPRRYSGRQRGAGPNGKMYPPITRHGRQKSLSEAIKTIRTRSGSVSQNALEIADALKAPVSPALVVLFSIWYFASVMSSTSSKQILDSFPKPVTLTIVQFVFVSGWCLFLSYLASIFPSLRRHIPALKNGIKRPSRDVIYTTLPLTAFMISGHILSSDAISRIPVSTVHTIKGLSPLFTVFAYRFIFHIRYTQATYLSLIPLTVGVILACSTNFSANFLGLLSAFASAILFVTQNIVSKRIFNEAALAESEPHRTKKPDKLNLLCYSSLLALAFTFPLWIWAEGWTIMVDFFSDASIELSGKSGSFDHGRLALEYVFNGTFHFTQSLAAFVLLSMVSPVTYSVASLVKRVFVILFSIIWFGNKVTRIQGLGIALTFLGLYLYDRTSDSHKADRRAKLLATSGGREPLLPLVEKPFESPPPTTSNQQFNFSFPHHVGSSADDKNGVGDGHVNPAPREGDKGNGWLPPGTKAQDTWKQGDLRVGVS